MGMPALLHFPLPTPRSPLPTNEHSLSAAMIPLRSLLALVLTIVYLASTVSAFAIERDVQFDVRAAATTTTSAVYFSQTLVNTKSQPPSSFGRKKVYAHHMIGNVSSLDLMSRQSKT